MRIILNDARAGMGEELNLDFALHEISRYGIRLQLTPQVFAVAAALAVSPGPMSPGEMAGYLYGEDGGPEQETSTVRVLALRARKALKIFGVEVETGPFGWQRGGTGRLSVPRGPRRKSESRNESR